MSEKIARWLQIAANFGILGGLLLVGLQMGQNERLLKLQILSQYNESYIAEHTTFAGENFSDTWQKSLEDPGNLTIAEMREMESHTFAPLLRWINLYRLSEAGIASDSVWKSEIRNDVGFYFGTVYGRNWWQYIGPMLDEEFMPSEVKAYINEQLEEIPDDIQLESYKKLRDIIRKNLNSKEKNT